MILKLDVYKNIDEYNADKERQILIVFDDMIADMVNNKKLNPMVTDLFLRGRKLNISFFFVTQSYFSSKDLIKIYKKCAVEPYSFLLMMLRLHQIIPSDLEKIFSTYNKIMASNDQTRDEKLQYDIIRKVAEISALSSGKIDKYGWLTGNEILMSNQRQVIEQAKFTYSPLGKAFEKQIKTVEDQGKK